ncbi:MAG: acetyl-CoA acetyltransferase [Rhodobiaceae bacterium]|nr:acetyl-CoA acetyltransferase [Rhodobiaceae bacterium]|tara:strand:- start:615 stop:2147 length:1533 start_codon:yes stop_codon:yes gene_type:complete
MINPKTPVLVGSGQITQKIENFEDAKNPIEIMHEASLLAIQDTGIEDLQNYIDSVVTVRFIFDSGAGARPPFSIFKNPPKSLANKLGINDAETFYGPTGGNTPQFLLNIFAERISHGQSEVVLLSGSECFSTMRKASKNGKKTGWGDNIVGNRIDLGYEKPGGTDNEIKHGIAFPVNVYPLFETAIRARMGNSIEKHQNYLGELFSPFTKIAKDHPNAWFPTERSASEISNVTETNRYIGYPYTKFMNAIMEVDQSATLIMMSEEKANQFKIPKEKRIYLHGCADINEVWNVTERPDLHSSKAIKLMGEKAFSMSKWNIDEIDFIDLYSCFPSMVELGREALGIGLNDKRNLTVTGGLPYFGGAGNNYVTHSIATIMDKLRENQGSKGLCTSNGWFATKHGIGLYSSEPFEGEWKRENPDSYQKYIDDLPKPIVEENPVGDAKIETYTVANGKDGPQMGIIIGRLIKNNNRFIAITKNESDLDKLMTEECLNRDCSVKQFDDGYSIVSIN